MGEDLNDFPEGQDGAHVKVILSTDGSPINDDNRGNAIKRSYTIREFDSGTKALTLDFVINLHQGPATNWALQAKVGDHIEIGGPGAPKLTDFSANSYLLIGDITSINAVNGFAKCIPFDASLTAIITLPTRADIIHMDARENFQVHWHIEDETTLSIEEFAHELVADLAQTKKAIHFEHISVLIIPQYL